MRHPVLLSILAACLVPVPGSAQSAEPTRRARPRAGPTIHQVYLHAGFGIGVGIASSEVTQLFNEELSVGLSGHLSLLAQVGVRNIAQVEVRATDASHNFNRIRIAGGQFQTIPRIKMDYDTRDVLFKVSPLAPVLSPVKAWFLVVGRGTVDWNDRNDDGFAGTSTILGVEYAVLARGAGVHLGLLRYDIEYDRATLLGMTLASNLSATTWVTYVSFGLGIGR